MKNMETELWDYIDGFCTEEEQKHIGFLIETDEIYRQKYAELLSFQSNLALLNPNLTSLDPKPALLDSNPASLDLEEPSMGFTYQLMEKIQTEKIIMPLKTRIDQRIIYAISGFFICMILALLVLVFANINWSRPSELKMPEMNFAAFNVFLNPVLIQGFLFFDMVLILFFADHYLRKWFLQQK